VSARLFSLHPAPRIVRQIAIGLFPVLRQPPIEPRVLIDVAALFA